MLLETCNREKWINQLYPNVAQRLCMIEKKWQDSFCQVFVEQVINILEFFEDVFMIK